MTLALRGIDGTREAAERSSAQRPDGSTIISSYCLLDLDGPVRWRRAQAFFLFRGAEWPALDPKGAGHGNCWRLSICCPIQRRPEGGVLDQQDLPSGSNTAQAMKPEGGLIW